MRLTRIMSSGRGWAALGLGMLVLILGCLPALAQTKKAPSPTNEVSLSQALSMALDYSPNIKQTLAELDRAASQQKEAFTYFLPSFSTSYGWQKTQDPPQFRTGAAKVVVNEDDIYQWSTGFKQPLFTGMRISSQYELAKLGVNLAEVNLFLAYLDVALKVKEQYFLYLRYIKGVKVSQEAVSQLEAQLKVSRDFYEVGIIPVNDVLKTEVRLSDAKQRLVSSKNDRALSRARLNRLLGLAVERKLRVKDILKSYPVEVDFQKFRLVARAERPELKAVDLQLKQADQSITKAKSGYYPEVNLRASYDFTSNDATLGDSEYNDATNWTITTQLDWAFWEWGRTAHQTSQQRADKRRLEAVKQQVEDEVDLQVKEATLFLREAQRNIVTSTTGVKQAEENYRVTFERYREQLTTNTELLDAQLLLAQARNNYYNALATFNIAEARLQRAMGRGLARVGYKKPQPDTSVWP
ncbi:MAG: TolC family protein [Desulfarculaceae bacterium]|nr:TolC family protein [Desulfarculaceae bacterium]MCF8073510.1 TolC family protein [Desulfarculaceae bacterium]MCF8100343.1 TolC family protein [Desulfarculaceae bacterium]MCF8117542.1 TolC family protein [Desulfarculaceae bacterium]